jgi:membrane fusion protein, heavy metal efflux system
MPRMPGMPSSDKPAAPAETPKEGEPVEVTLTPEAVERAGIKTTPVRSESAAAAISVPATVTSDAYRDTKVSALVGGVVRQVHVELGAAVERGQLLAVVFSAELAEAQMKYLSMGAMLEADHRKLERTRKLLEIGAASRQEFEEVAAVHAGHASETAAARQRLLLLGLSSEQVGRLQDASHVVSEVTVSAPSRGAVIARSVNPGQIVMAAQDLFVVTDLGTVWVIGDVYEKDMPSVRVGTEATVTVPFGGRGPVRGRIAYIDPRVDPATRTTKVRIEVPNPNGSLRLGMFVTVSFQTGAGVRMTLVPRAAVQSVGDRSVVYVPTGENEPRFLEQPVKLGQVVGDFVQVLEGLQPGQKVVTEGSFLLRAEAARSRAGG